jgi:hypothetical protein
MPERRFALVDFTYRGKRGRLRFHEAGHTYALPRAVAHAATKRELVAKQRPPHWTPPSIFRPPEVLTEVEVTATCSQFVVSIPRAASEQALATIGRQGHDTSRSGPMEGINQSFDLS